MASEERDKWNHRYRQDAAPSDPEPFLTSLAPRLPKGGRALDVGGGAGRHAVWLAQQGFETTLVDIAEVGLRVAETCARSCGVSLRTIAADLESEPLPAGPWDLILCHHFLLRSLLPQFEATLADNGILVMVHPTVRNLERHARPSRRYLLEEGELRGAFSSLSLELDEEGWFPNGRHEARILARRRT